MNRGSVGFLMNEFREDDLTSSGSPRPSAPPSTRCGWTRFDVAGNEHRAYAINEVSLFRQSYQTAKLKISIDGQTCGSRN